jgi:hypothetical protein
MVAVVAALATLPLATLSCAPAAYAAPATTSITVDGPGLTTPVTLQAGTEPFVHLLSEVSWLATRPGNAPSPDAANLGPKYQVVVRVDERPDQTYDLYPLAIGGPRVFRPAEQPNKKKTAAAWFYGRLSMPDALRSVGVPLVFPGGPVPLTGGQGGGGPVAAGTVTTTPGATSIGDIIGEWQRQMLLLAGGSVILLVLIGFFARLVRRV